MKSLTAFLSKPKIVIPVFGVIIVAAGFGIYHSLSTVPNVPVSIETGSMAPRMVQTDADTAHLSFTKAGRLEAILVHEGDAVKAGQVVAQLSAPDALGAISQTKGALDLAEAQYASLNTQYATAKKQQDLLVATAYRTLLSAGLEGTPDNQNDNNPIISGTYACDTEGTYILKAYASGDPDSGYTLKYSGLEEGIVGVKYDAPVPLGACGLQVRFSRDKFFDPNTTWTISIPNTKSSSYLANKNAYELAVATREKTLSDLAATLGTGGDGSGVAKAQIEAARGAYEAAVGAYQNNLLTSPIDGIVSFIDKDAKVGQSVVPNKTIISIQRSPIK